ncbi:MAG TPA: TetR/AcrR family transcriptional regulator [Pseudonocardiaceae bacterium]|jgi:AcrR family transcriptional regulator
MATPHRTRLERSPTERTDPRVARTEQALTQAMVKLAAERPVSQITVADLAERAGVTRATFYNRYNSPLELLIQALHADLETGHREEDARRAEGQHSPAALLRLATTEVGDHVERFHDIYRQALHDPADHGVYEALAHHFADYSMAFIARCTHPGLPVANHQIIGQFVANGFVGAIKAWLGDDSVTKADLVEAAVACAPIWWG